MKVSVIIPVYNAAAFVTRCLESVSRQTYRDFEIVAVDDGSTDGSGALLDRLAGELPLHVIHQPNQGQSVARNVAMREARGEYVLMVDADDFLHPRLLEFAVGLADRQNLDFVQFGFRQVPFAEIDAVRASWAAEDASPDVVPIRGRAFEWFVGERQWPVPWQFLYRRRTLADAAFRPGVIYEDIPFVLTYLAAHDRGAVLRNPLYGYVQREGSTTHDENFSRRIEGYEYGMRHLKSVLDDRRYRLFEAQDCAGWIRCLWRIILRVPDSARRDAALRELRAFLVRCDGDGLLRAGDFSGFWRLRYWLAVRKGGR